MGTVGLNFGSATSGQGFDVASTVTQILASTGLIENPWKTELTSLGTQDTALTALGTDLSALSTKLQALTDFNGIFAQKQGSSSLPNILTLTGAGPTAIAGSHTIIVNSLAQTSSVYSGTIAAAGDTLSGSLTVQVGSGSAQTFAVDSSSNTLASLAAGINAANLGVTASIIGDATGSRLSLVSSTSGAGGQLTIGGSLHDDSANVAIGFQTGQVGLNASLSVDGIALSSAQNTVTTAIPGVSFQLLSAVPGTPVQVQIANDTGSIASAFGDLVIAYNKVQTDLKTQEGKDASGHAQPLFGSTTLSLLQTQISGALLAGAPSGSINSISQFGISLQSDGSLKVNNTDLLAALNTHFADITGFLQNTSGLGRTLSNTLDTLGTQTPRGLVSLALQQNSAQETSLNKSVSDEDARLAVEKIRLTAELNTANQILQSIPAQIAQINEVYSAVTGYNTK